ncbi:hypothetical protein [Tsuneonella mangrovi]|uniref:hypothetical protein n=1 Tax=Tsuneonella mangrovi TaxID=1982042 RepID=UPI000BA26B5F|nr:hypothetical protein [Tsuneonella mangrovi]
MNTRTDQIVETETHASGGSKEGVVRWVLGVGLILAIASLSLIWINGATDHPISSGQGDVSAQIAQQKAQDDDMPDAIAANKSDELSPGSENYSYNGMLEIEQNRHATQQQ